MGGTMPVTDPVSSISGRNSRASNVSGVTAASRSIRAHPPPNDMLSSAGVLSMLKTTTDTSDIGNLSHNSARFPTMPRATHQRRGYDSRPPVSNRHHYAPSQISGVSSSRDWETISNQRRGSLTSMQSMPPSLPPVHLGKDPMQLPPPTLDLQRHNNRSYSLTSASAAQQLPRHRSASSLKSREHEPRAPPPQHRARPPPPVMQENRPPYVYPSRFKRPGYRSPSPALSDSYARAPPPPQQPPAPRRGPMLRPPPPQTYNSDYGPEYGRDLKHLNMRPPPRAMSISPVTAYSDPPPSHHPYRNPAAMRSAPGLSMPSQPPADRHFDHHPQGVAVPPHARRGPPQLPPQGYSHPPAMHRPMYPGQPYPGRPGPGYHYAPVQYAGHRPVPPPPPNVAPVAHQMFHNAARLARHLPQRTDTPITDGGPPSSDPPSSGTVPSSSSPPTPQDHSTSQVAVDPIFVEPALVDLQESSSEPVLAHQYLRYAEGLEKDVDDSEIEVAHPSVPPSGFVQRVKAMLESKATAEAAASHEFEREKVSPVPPADEEMAIVQYGNNVDDFGVHELAANEAARFTIIEEYEAPVELPASPVRLAELPASPVQPRRRITREMVKAELAPSSLDNTMLQTDSGDSTSIDFVLGCTPRHSVASGKDQPSTPANVIPKKSVDAASESTASPIAIEVSTVDYATRLDDTASSDETHSKDPFILDADTITLQHQRSKERVNKAGQLFEQDEAQSAQDPVSSMLTGEDVSRYSAVSPMHTQTLGIDETIRTAPDNTANDSTFADELDRTVPGAYPEETQPASTPKTPKIYSKSVQLQPTTALTDASTPTSSRLSLPPDLSSYADSSMNDTSELVTDVAVRFSLHQTTITVNKPQIIEIPPSSSPVHEMTLAQLAKPTIYASTSRAKRGLVTFADEIAPLNITKPAHHKPTEPQVVRKSIIRRVSPLHDFADASRASRESTTDLRFTGINPMNNRFGNTHLPRLKEESIEDASISDRHKSDGSIGFQFPLPARIAAVKAMQERRLQESAENARTRRGHRFPNRPLSETRDLPSLNFSRMDLIDKLNEALEVRSSKSMELLRRRDFSAIYAPSPQRPQSTEPLRERYMSFFSKPEDFSSVFLDQDGSEDGADEHDEVKPDQLPNAEVQPSTEVGAATDGNRPLSPEDFLSFANQVKRLSIPSVTGLSDRLSEMLPNLRDLQLDSVLANFSEVTEAMRDGVRPGTILSTRTSAGFRTLAERAEEIVKNGTHDSTLPVTRLLSTHGVLPDGMSADKISAINSIDGRLSALTGSVSAPSELGKDVTRPASALTRARGPANEEEVQALLPPEMNPITRSAKRALLVSSSSSRPWNQDENYPWAGTKIDVDLMVPSQAHTRSSMASEILRKRKTKSLEIGSTGDVSSITKGIDIGSLYEHNATASLNSEQLTGVSSPHHEGHGKSSKRSVMGSLTHKLGLGSKCDGNTTIRSIPTPSDVVRSGSTVPHRPGERYPTSGLTPPAGFNLDEVRSFFSDDSSERERNASFRKRLTKLKGKKSAVRLDGCDGGMARRHSHRRSLDDDTAYDAGLMSVERAGATSSALTIDGVGMSKTEFRIKRFGEKIRSLMAKGGELIRSLSQRSSKVVGHGRVDGGNGGGVTRAVRDDWLSDSLYSGV